MLTETLTSAAIAELAKVANAAPIKNRFIFFTPLWLVAIERTSADWDDSRSLARMQFGLRSLPWVFLATTVTIHTLTQRCSGD